jgi:hypothetical protein
LLFFLLDWRDTAAILASRASNGSRGVETMDQQTGKQSAWSWWYLLLLAQFVFLLWVPFYNAVEPTWAGVPFFYWYQMLWVIISGVLTAIVYFATND